MTNRRSEKRTSRNCELSVESLSARIAPTALGGASVAAVIMGSGPHEQSQLCDRRPTAPRGEPQSPRLQPLLCDRRPTAPRGEPQSPRLQPLLCDRRPTTPRTEPQSSLLQPFLRTASSQLRCHGARESTLPFSGGSRPGPCCFYSDIMPCDLLRSNVSAIIFVESGGLLPCIDINEL